MYIALNIFWIKEVAINHTDMWVNYLFGRLLIIFKIMLNVK